MKTCTKCKESKYEALFSKNPLGKNGLHSQCKSCRSLAAHTRGGKYKARTISEIPVLFSPKRCWRCKKEKLRDEFFVSKRGSDGLASECRECSSDRQSRDLYGLPMGKFQELLERQGHACAICKTTNARSKGRFHVDHEHVPGFKDMSGELKRKHIRGLLCGNCNHILGVVEQNIGAEALRGSGFSWSILAYQYLQRHKETPCLS